MLSYEVLYDRLLDMTEFGKTVTSCLNRKQLIEVIEQHAARIFSFDDWDILLYEEPQKRFRSFSTLVILCQNTPFSKPAHVNILRVSC